VLLEWWQRANKLAEMSEYLSGKFNNSFVRVIRFTCYVLSNCSQFSMHDAQDTASNTVNTLYKLSIVFCNSVFVIKPKQTAHLLCANHTVSAVRNVVCKHLCGYSYNIYWPCLKYLQGCWYHCIIRNSARGGTVALCFSLYVCFSLQKLCDCPFILAKGLCFIYRWVKIHLTTLRTGENT